MKKSFYGFCFGIILMFSLGLGTQTVISENLTSPNTTDICFHVYTDAGYTMEAWGIGSIALPDGGSTNIPAHLLVQNAQGTYGTLFPSISNINTGFGQ
jgi:hypothetical protein